MSGRRDVLQLVADENGGVDRSLSVASLGCIFLLSTATLTYEINLTRLFSVAQFYHFAFMIVSLALLGYGSSGALLTLFPGWVHKPHRRILFSLSLLIGVGILGSYLLTNLVPFDSFSIAWDWRQVGVLALHYFGLTLPFTFSGLAVGVILASFPKDVGKTYSINFIGSACGCVVALVAPSVLGGEGTTILSCGFAILAALLVYQCQNWTSRKRVQCWIAGGISVTLLLLVSFDLGSRVLERSTQPILNIRLSPYKSLSYALQFPGAEITSSNWNAFSRVDIVSSAGIRSLPGLSYLFPKPPPPEYGLFVDGDNLSPVVLPGADLSFTSYMPTAIAYQLRPQAEALVLEPRGGLELLIGLEEGIKSVTAVEVNQLITSALPHIYDQPEVNVVIESDRSYLRRIQQNFDVVVFALTHSYHPITSGVYSLGEDYRYTLESFRDALSHLKPDGLLVVSRWLQFPPSEFLRAYGLAVSTLENAGLKPSDHLVAFRSFNIGVLLIKPTQFSPKELEAIRVFCKQRAFDLVMAPDVMPDEVNQYNILNEPFYFNTFNELLVSVPRAAWYADYPFDVTPPEDDRPFFGHYFKWEQLNQVISEFGKTMQPFGGAGYLVVLILLIMVLVLASILILLPIYVTQRRPSPEIDSQALTRGDIFTTLGYFLLIGLGYLMVEIPLIQQFILFLGQPSYALTTVLFTLLLFSGIGSRLADRIPHRGAMLLLVGFILISPWGLPMVFNLALGLSLPLRIGITVVSLAPLGFLMGMPFPRGLQRILGLQDRLIPWVWGVNGAASVVSSILSALIALSFGYRLVLFFGAISYFTAWVVAPGLGLRERKPLRQ
jgi:hypothetical protein